MKTSQAHKRCSKDMLMFVLPWLVDIVPPKLSLKEWGTGIKSRNSSKYLLFPPLIVSGTMQILLQSSTHYWHDKSSVWHILHMISFFHTKINLGNYIKSSPSNIYGMLTNWEKKKKKISSSTEIIFKWYTFPHLANVTWLKADHFKGIWIFI